MRMATTKRGRLRITGVSPAARSDEEEEDSQGGAVGPIAVVTEWLRFEPPPAKYGSVRKTMRSTRAMRRLDAEFLAESKEFKLLSVYPVFGILMTIELVAFGTDAVLSRAVARDHEDWWVRSIEGAHLGVFASLLCSMVSCLVVAPKSSVWSERVSLVLLAVSWGLASCLKRHPWTLGGSSETAAEIFASESALLFAIISLLSSSVRIAVQICIVYFVVVFALTVAVAISAGYSAAICAKQLVLLLMAGASGCLWLREAWSMEMSQRSLFLLVRTLRRTQVKTYGLLMNVLPLQVMVKLQQDGKFLEYSTKTAVLFCCMVDYDGHRERLFREGDKGMLRFLILLQQVVRGLDGITEKNHGFKVEHINDDYICTSHNVLDSSKLNDDAISELVSLATALAGFQYEYAIRVQDAEHYIEEHYTVRFRVGIHCGPVVAGVIGRSRKFYRVFGDTVNVASRIARRAAAGEVLVSGDVRCLVVGTNSEDEIAFSSRGIFSLKGKGDVELFKAMHLCPLATPDAHLSSAARLHISFSAIAKSLLGDGSEGFMTIGRQRIRRLKLQTLTEGTSSGSSGKPVESKNTGGTSSSWNEDEGSFRFGSQVGTSVRSKSDEDSEGEKGAKKVKVVDAITNLKRFNTRPKSGSRILRHASKQAAALMSKASVSKLVSITKRHTASGNLDNEGTVLDRSAIIMLDEEDPESDGAKGGEAELDRSSISDVRDRITRRNGCLRLEFADVRREYDFTQAYYRERIEAAQRFCIFTVSLVILTISVTEIATMAKNSDVNFKSDRKADVIANELAAAAASIQLARRTILLGVFLVSSLVGFGIRRLKNYVVSDDLLVELLAEQDALDGIDESTGSISSFGISTLFPMLSPRPGLIARSSIGLPRGQRRASRFPGEGASWILARLLFVTLIVIFVLFPLHPTMDVCPRIETCIADGLNVLGNANTSSATAIEANGSKDNNETVSSITWEPLCKDSVPGGIGTASLVAMLAIASLNSSALTLEGRLALGSVLSLGIVASAVVLSGFIVANDGDDKGSLSNARQWVFVWACMNGAWIVTGAFGLVVWQSEHTESVGRQLFAMGSKYAKEVQDMQSQLNNLVPGVLLRAMEIERRRSRKRHSLVESKTITVVDLLDRGSNKSVIKEGSRTIKMLLPQGQQQHGRPVDALDTSSRNVNKDNNKESSDDDDFRRDDANLSGEKIFELLSSELASLKMAKVQSRCVVLYADIVGFTPLSDKYSPLDIARILDTIYSCFDELVILAGVFKMDTIGDAFIVVGGLDNDCDKDEDVECVERVDNGARVDSERLHSRLDAWDERNSKITAASAGGDARTQVNIEVNSDWSIHASTGTSSEGPAAAASPKWSNQAGWKTIRATFGNDGSAQAVARDLKRSLRARSGVHSGVLGHGHRNHGNAFSSSTNALASGEKAQHLLTTMVDLALDMQEVLRSFSDTLGFDVSMRIGVAEGKVVGGLVGLIRNRFQIIGPAMKEANDLEKTGVAGFVHVAPDIAERLHGLYQIKDRSEYISDKQRKRNEQVELHQAFLAESFRSESMEGDDYSGSKPTLPPFLDDCNPPIGTRLVIGKLTVESNLKGMRADMATLVRRVENLEDKLRWKIRAKISRRKSSFCGPTGLHELE